MDAQIATFLVAWTFFIVVVTELSDTSVSDSLRQNTLPNKAEQLAIVSTILSGTNSWSKA